MLHYYAEQSCTAGRTAFFTGMHPMRAGMLMPELPGAISYLRPGTPALAKFMLDLGYNTGEFGKNYLGDRPDSLPTAHGFQEFWGYLYHLDAMQGVSFPDINSSPTDQAVVPRMKTIPIPGIPEAPGTISPRGRRLHGGPAASHLDEIVRRHGGKPERQGRRPAHSRTLEDGRRGNFRQSHRLARPQRSRQDGQAVLLLVQPGADAHHHDVLAEV
jgi:hypothetical protein